MNTTTTTTTITHITTYVAGIKSAVKHSIRIGGRNAGYVFSGHYSDPQNYMSRKYRTEIMAYLKANNLIASI